MIIPTSPIRPLLPPTLPITTFKLEVAAIILSAILVTGIALLVAWVMTRMMANKGYKQNKIANFLLSGGFALALFVRFGLSVTLLQGMFLFFVLLYASLSDITHHEVDDCVWIIIFALSLVSIPQIGLSSMVIGGLFVLIPQLIPALLPPHRTVGGADIKISIATAFLLGATRGISAYLIGLVIAVIVMSIYKSKHKYCPKKPFALVPFLSIATLAMFLV